METQWRRRRANPRLQLNLRKALSSRVSVSLSLSDFHFHIHIWIQMRDSKCSISLWLIRRISGRVLRREQEHCGLRQCNFSDLLTNASILLRTNYYLITIQIIKRFIILSRSYLLISQPGKSLYTTVRELVENALDSAESISELPVVEITM